MTNRSRDTQRVLAMHAPAMWDVIKDLLDPHTSPVIQLREKITADLERAEERAALQHARKSAKARKTGLRFANDRGVYHDGEYIGSINRNAPNEWQLTGQGGWVDVTLYSTSLTGLKERVRDQLKPPRPPR